jgi:hypothetical protein
MSKPRSTASRVRLDRNGYDATGAYWGRGKPLFYVSLANGDEVTLRANDRRDAIARAERDATGAYVHHDHGTSTHGGGW